MPRGVSASSTGGGGSATRFAFCISTMNASPNNLANGGLVTFDTDKIDASSLHDASSNKERFVANAAGTWRLIAFIKRTSSSSTGDFLAIRTNAAADSGNAYSRFYFNSTGIETANLQWEGTLAINEYMYVTHNGGTTNTYAGDGTGVGEISWARFERFS